MRESDKKQQLQFNNDEPIHSSDVSRNIISTPSSNKVYPTSQITSLSDEQDNDLDPLESSAGLNSIEINR